MLDCCIVLAQAVLFVLVIVLAMVIRVLPLIVAFAGTWIAATYAPESAVSIVGLIGLTAIVAAAFFMPTWADLLAAWSEGKRRTLDDDPLH